MTHTPGPWKHTPAHGCEMTRGGNIKGPDGNIVCDVRGLDGQPHESNACLIVAAPDLLEAAKEALEELYRVSPSHAAPKLRAAIAKATWDQQ